MYKRIKVNETSVKVNEAFEGETIEQKIRRITLNKEPIEDGAPLVYTERQEGVRIDTDVRTDRFEIAVEAMDKMTRSKIAERENKMKVVSNNLEGKELPKGNDGGDIGATNP